jgi:DNA-binding NarL/FixJ family response regulator
MAAVRGREERFGRLHGRAEKPHETRRRPITVVVGRFDSLVGHGVEQVLRGDPRVRVVGSALDDAQLERAIANEAPHVAVLAGASPGVLLSSLRAARTATQLIVIAPNPGRLCGELLVSVGASCLTEGVSDADILVAVHRAAGGESFYMTARENRGVPVARAAGPLTGREQAVFDLLGEGRTNAEVADALQISPGTVGTHVHRIFRKLGVHSRKQLIGMQMPERGN